MRRVVAALFAAMATAVCLAATAAAIPEQGTPEFDTYMQGLERNGFNLNPDTAWRLAHQATLDTWPDQEDRGRRAVIRSCRAVLLDGSTELAEQHHHHPVSEFRRLEVVEECLQSC